MTHEQTLAIQATTILAQARFFGDLNAEQIARVAAICELRELAQGEQVYRVGEPALDMYVLVRGMVRMAVGYGGRDASAGDVLRRGDVFGWAAMTPTCKLRVATTTCITPCTFLALDGTRLLALMEQDHTLGFRLMTQLAQLITGTVTAFAGG